MTDTDPALHFDGTRWLRWDGTQWSPAEQVADVAAAVTGQSFPGYGIDVKWNGADLHVHPRNKASWVALLGKGNHDDLHLPVSDVVTVEHKPARTLTNGCVTVVDSRGSSYQLHFLKKHGDDFAQLADELAAAVATAGRTAAASTADAGPASEWDRVVTLTAAVCTTTTTVVGTDHYWGIRSLAAGMYPVDLVREPGNTHDANAIGVHINGAMIGHVNADHAQRYAPAMDVTGVTVRTMAVCELNGDSLVVRVHVPQPKQMDAAIRACWPS